MVRGIKKSCMVPGRNGVKVFPPRAGEDSGYPLGGGGGCCEAARLPANYLDLHGDPPSASINSSRDLLAIGAYVVS